MICTKTHLRSWLCDAKITCIDVNNKYIRVNFSKGDIVLMFNVNDRHTSFWEVHNTVLYDSMVLRVPSVSIKDGTKRI